MMWHPFERYLGTAFALHVWNGILIFAAVMALGFVTKVLLDTVIRTLVGKTKTNLDDKVFDILVPRVKWLSIIAALYFALEELVLAVPPADRIEQHWVYYSENIIYVCFVLFLAFLFTKLIDATLMHAMEQHARRTSAAVNEALFPIVNRLVMILIFVIAGVTVLGHFGVNVSSLLVFLGGGSVAIALAAQETLSNMIAGFVIMIERPFRVGDRVKIPSGEVGDVYNIGLRSTTILDFDNNLIVSPNAELTKSKLVNYSYPRTEIRVLVEVPVAYGTSIEHARCLILGFAQEHPLLLKEPAPQVVLSVMGESSCTLQLIARTDDWKKKGLAEQNLREQIYGAFLKEGISSGYAQHVVQLTSPPHDAPKNN